MIELNTVYNEDCLEGMKRIPDKSVDMILCDLPYGTTSCKWDSTIPFEPLWEQYERIIKDNGAIVLFCQQPFTSALIMSNPKLFKYMFYWRKSRPSGFVNANLKPLKDIEEIAIFSNGKTANGSKNNMQYNPQGIVEVNKAWSRPKKYFTDNGVNPTRDSHGLTKTVKYENYPRQVLDFGNSNKDLMHPTQKPVPLFEYLIKTYSNEGETILDNCMGSGTTAIATINTNRNYIGFELDETYFNLANDRISNHINTQVED